MISFFQDNKELISSLPIPKLIDFTQNDNRYQFVFEAVQGLNVSENMALFGAQQKKDIVYQVIKFADVLERNGIYHNDIRSWNIIVKRDKNNNQKAIVIDFDMVRKVKTEEPLDSILWLMFELNKGIVDDIQHNKRNILLVPPSDYGIFSNIAAAIIDKKVTNMQELLSFIEKNNNQ